MHIKILICQLKKIQRQNLKDGGFLLTISSVVTKFARGINLTYADIIAVKWF